MPKEISREYRHQDLRAPASSVPVARRAPAAEPPRLNPAGRAKRIRARSFSASPAKGALRKERELALMEVRAHLRAPRGTGRTLHPYGEVRGRTAIGSHHLPVRSYLKCPLSLRQDSPGCNHIRRGHL